MSGVPARIDVAAFGAERDRAPTEVTQFALEGGVCRLLLVDGVVPRHSAKKSGGRVRMTYASDEISHFEFAGHLYSVVPSAPEPAPTLPQHGESGYAPTEIHRLLTQRELEVVQLICLGFLTKQVADRLHISEFTVRSYLKTTYAKLGVRSRASLVFRYTQAFKRSVQED